MTSVHTNLTKADTRRAVLALLTRRSVLFKGWLVWAAVIAAILSVIRGMPHSTIDVVVLAISSGIASIASVAVTVTASLLRATRLLNSSAGVLGDHEFTLSADGLFEKTTANESLSKWHSIKGIFQRSEYYFVEMSQGAFHIIPLRSFASEADQQAFYVDVLSRVGPVA